MNFLQKQFSDKMIEEVRKEINKLDKDSPYLKDLNGIDIDKVLSADISRICEEISMSEIMTIMPLVVKLKVAAEKKELADIHNQIKEIALKVVGRVELKGGKLNIPDSCRNLLLEL